MLIRKESLFFKLFTIFMETSFFALNYYTHFYVYKYKLFNIKLILFNIFLFLVYNIFLYLNNTNIYKHYMIDNLTINK